VIRLKAATAKLLACPSCKSDLNLVSKEERKSEVYFGALVCKECEEAYPIINYIPRFTGSQHHKMYDFFHKSHLGKTWIKKERNFPHERLDLNRKELKNKVVLEIGCGIGTYTSAYKEHDPKLIIGIDMSEGVDEALKNTGFNKNTDFIQANVFHLPFKEEAFDVIYSTGVLHHTGNTKKAFACLPSLLKHNGLMTICVYSVRTNALTLKYWRRVTTKIPNSFVYALSLGLTPLSYVFKYIKPLAIFNYMIPVTILEGKQTLKDFAYIWSNIFDDLTVAYLEQHTYPEVYSWFKDAGFKKNRGT